MIDELESKALVILEAVKWAVFQGWREIKIETDSMMVFIGFQKPYSCFWKFKPCFSLICKVLPSFDLFDLSLVKCEVNARVDCLASYGKKGMTLVVELISPYLFYVLLFLLIWSFGLETLMLIEL